MDTTAMTEEQIRTLVQQSAWFGFGFLVVAVVLHYLTDIEVEGGPRRWTILVQRFQAWQAARRRYVEPHQPEFSDFGARTCAAGGAENFPHWDAGAEPVRGAVRGAGIEIPAGSLLLSAEEQEAVAAMVRHKIAAPSAKKLDTIQAGWPEIRARSGDPQSRYARASAIYDALIAPPPQVGPVSGRELPPGQRYVGEIAGKR